MIYEPAEDSFLLEKFVRKFSKDKKVLDMGCGSGILSLVAKESGALEVLSVDIVKESLEVCKQKGLNILKSDLFEHVSGKFDLIVFNPPYLPADSREDFESAIITSGGEKGDEIILRFLKESVSHLEDNGTILLLVSSLTPSENIERLIGELGLVKRLLGSEKVFMERLEVWEINLQ